MALTMRRRGEFVPFSPTGSITTGAKLVPGAMKRPFGSPFKAMTPLNTADHDARFVWLTESRPRVALSLKAVVNISRSAQSFAGWVSSASYVQFVVAKLVGATANGKIFVSNWPRLTIIWPLPTQLLHTVRSTNGLIVAQE